MKAAVLYEARNPLVIEDIQLDPPKSGEVHIKVGAAGICRSDLHIIKGHAKHRLPAVLGHEGSGTVLEVGRDVTRVKPGDKVILSFVPFCGHCDNCLEGRANLCNTHADTSGTRISHMGKVSCFAEEAVVPETGCIPVSHDFPLPQAALIGCCVPTGIGAVMFNAKINPGSTVVVVGVGGVGLNVVQGAKLLSASKIIAIDPNESALEFATKFGVTNTINPTEQDPVQAVKDITGGSGADYSFEVFGSSETVQTAYNSVKKGGTVIVVGLTPLGDDPTIDANRMTRQEITLRGSYYGSVRPALDMPTMVNLYKAGKIDIDNLITRTYKLDDINKAYQDMENGQIGRGVITQF